MSPEQEGAVWPWEDRGARLQSSRLPPPGTPACPWVWKRARLALEEHGAEASVDLQVQLAWDKLKLNDLAVQGSAPMAHASARSLAVLCFHAEDVSMTFGKCEKAHVHGDTAMLHRQTVQAACNLLASHSRLWRALQCVPARGVRRCEMGDNLWCVAPVLDSKTTGWQCVLRGCMRPRSCKPRHWVTSSGGLLPLKLEVPTTVVE
eukprot:CAMPEP_0171081462 /NCGR_PEP_ID=MMETSP0766_2-20121228/16509_1 /TAXON_ID=439317 /ORGANISM="Gambierdiscus australes, Strain CAWD 149" /LENGTH=204 /DNA_ID=CAMNT_0011538765 /DNA_START=79 /DNA_END=691 /DNA_ORIENTATION=-